MKDKYKVIALSAIFGLFVWVIDAILDYLFFYEGSFFELLILDVPFHEIYTRSAVIITFIIFGIIISKILAQRKKVEESLQTAHQELESRVEERTTELKAGYEQLQKEISERKQIEEALRESEEKYRKLVGASKDAIISVDENDKIVVFNKAAEEMFGFKPQEVFGKTQRVFVPPEYLERHTKGIKKFFKKGEGKFIGKTVELEALRKNKERFPIELTLFSFETLKGRFATAIIKDITERKKAEEEIKRRLMKFRLEEGNLYLVKESVPTLSLEAFKDLLRIDYQGFVISRTPEENFKKVLEDVIEFLWVSEKGGEKALPPDLKEIERRIENLPRKSAILIDRLDYLVFKMGFEKTLSFVQRLRELAYIDRHIIILSIDPSTFAKRELRLLEKEALEVEPLHKVRLPEDLLEALRFIYKENSMGVKPSYTDVGMELGISRPTARKRIKRLVSVGYVMDVIKGNRKVVELTERGRSLFME